MSKSRRDKRKNERIHEVHVENLTMLLGEFYEFAGKREKPTGEELRSKFIECDKRWVAYCHKIMPYPLNHKFKGEFNKQVSSLWKQMQKK